jgi:hypothetical protein
MNGWQGRIRSTGSQGTKDKLRYFRDEVYSMNPHSARGDYFCKYLPGIMGAFSGINCIAGGVGSYDTPHLENAYW